MESGSGIGALSDMVSAGDERLRHGFVDIDAGAGLLAEVVFFELDEHSGWWLVDSGW